MRSARLREEVAPPSLSGTIEIQDHGDLSAFPRLLGRLDLIASTDFSRIQVRRQSTSNPAIRQQLGTRKRSEAQRRTWLAASAARRTRSLLDPILSGILSLPDPEPISRSLLLTRH